MQFGDYEVRINQGEEVDEGYVLLEHNTKYSITLTNNNIDDCDAKIIIDGVCVGTFRVSSHSNTTIERPSSEGGCFTFLKFDSEEAIQAKLNKNQDLGLVSVKFMPQKRIEQKRIPQAGGFMPQRAQHVSAGGTGLSGWSSQKFNKVKPLDYDEERTIKINLRLICKEKDMIRPLVTSETDTPPSLFDSFDEAAEHTKNKKNGYIIRSSDGKGFLWRP